MILAIPYSYGYVPGMRKVDVHEVDVPGVVLGVVVEGGDGVNRAPALAHQQPESEISVFCKFFFENIDQ